MEAIALKSSLRSELAMIQAQQPFFEDLWSLNANNNGVVPSEDFSVDCFFDFSNGEFNDGAFVDHEQDIDEEEEDEEAKDSLSVSSSQDRLDDDGNSNSSGFSDSNLFTSELPVPIDDLQDLEWVSHFVDDSSSELALLYPAGEEKSKSHAKSGFEPEPKRALTGTSTSCLFPSWVPTRARTKRTRTSGRTWSVGSPLTESPTASLASSTSSSSTPCLVITNTAQTNDSFHGFSEPPMKQPRKSQADQIQTGGLVGSTQFQRRCSHCHVQKTPQWRTGPLGPKTLCNACGVRYKSGRLFPEYRPACSPTFSSDMHSNSHRKVIEMRKQKEMPEPDSLG